MITVTVRIVKKRGLALSKELEFRFSTQAEAIAFTSGLRVVDGIQRNERFFDAIVSPDGK